MFSRNIPIRAMITVVPAKRTARPGGVDGADRRLVRLVAFVEVVAEAGDDEERVVDPDPEPDHRRQDRREVRRVEDPGPERDQAEADPEREQRGDDRQPHRDHRAEGEQQDDDRRQQADRERGVAAFFFGFVIAWPPSWTSSALPGRRPARS